MKLYLIRHGQTEGNRQGRYVGATDESILPQARESLAEMARRLREECRPDLLCVSPLRRCRETAAILFPGREQRVTETLRECDFGEFEYCNYEELNGDPAYQRFIDSGGTCGFPGGETLRQFQDRCVRGFRGVIESTWEQDPDQCVVLVVHGGTIMAILDRYSQPHRDYFSWRTENGNGYAADLSYDRESGELTLERIVNLGERRT